MEKALTPGSQTFEQSLFKMIKDGLISQDEGLANADSANNLLWLMNNTVAGADLAGWQGTQPAGKTRGTHRSAPFSEFKLDVDRDGARIALMQEARPSPFPLGRGRFPPKITMPAVEPGATLRLARELIARRSVTPEDGGCQGILAERLARVGFTLEPVRHREVSNLWARRGDARPLVCSWATPTFVPTGPIEKWDSDPFVPTERDGKALRTRRRRHEDFDRRFRGRGRAVRREVSPA